MALSATISLSASNVVINQAVTATLTLSNSGGAAINVLGVTPLAFITGSHNPETSACALGFPPVTAGNSLIIPASGSLVMPFGCTFFSPSTTAQGLGTGTYSVGATCFASDGSTFSPTAATITVSPLPLPQIPSAANSIITAAATTVANLGTVKITLSTLDYSKNPVTSGGYLVVFSNSGGSATGTFSTAIDNHDGTYSSIFTASGAGTATTIHATINGKSVTSTPLPTIIVT